MVYPIHPPLARGLPGDESMDAEAPSARARKVVAIGEAGNDRPASVIRCKPLSAEGASSPLRHLGPPAVARRVRSAGSPCILTPFGLHAPYCGPAGPCARGPRHGPPSLPSGTHSATAPAATQATTPRPMNRAYSMPDYPHLSRIIADAARCAPLASAVVMPTEPTALAGALQAAQSGLVAPILVGPRSSIARAARADHPYQSRGLGAGPHCLLRTRSSLYPPRCRGKERQ